MGNAINLPVGDNNVGLTIHNGRNQVRDIASRVLVIAIGVDDDVSSQ